MNDVEYFGFAWDKDKTEQNKIKLGISFETAVHIFDDPLLIETYDVNHSDAEDRYKYIGTINSFLILAVIGTDRDGKIRIISARKADRNEEKLYYEKIEKLQLF